MWSNLKIVTIWYVTMIFLTVLNNFIPAHFVFLRRSLALFFTHQTSLNQLY